MTSTTDLSSKFFVLLNFFSIALCQQQIFLVEPTDTDAVAGSIVTLRCRVGNQVGKVQWTRDGFALGYLRGVPGFPRYKMTGNRASGVHDLQITNVTLDDDADFQCQVGATLSNKGIRATAHLNVLLPPESVQIQKYSNGSIIEVKEDEEVELTCIVKDGKPAATVRWYRENSELKIESEDYSTEETGKEQRQNAISTIKVLPASQDNEISYSCQAVHPALKFPMKSIVRLSVLYPPGPPVIQGYQEGEIVRMGDTLTLTCISRGGNPLAKVVWFKNNIHQDHSYTTKGQKSVNALSFVVGASDNNAIFRCEVSNKETPAPMSESIRLTVHFSPDKASIKGPRQASLGDLVTMRCKTARSNPPAEISWLVDGRRFTSQSQVRADPQGGWITFSNISVKLTTNERNSKTFSCYASNKALGETIVETKVLSVLHPPDHPNIFGENLGQALRIGNTQRLKCVAMGGNPLADITWFKGKKKLDSENTKTGTISSSAISFILDQTDNGVEYRCEAKNPATRRPLKTKVKLSVHFPPSGVSIKIHPKVLSAGEKALLTCESGSSNPASTVTWWKNGFMKSGEYNGTFDAPNGGKSTRNYLRLNVTSQDDGAVYTCQATNQILTESVHDGVTLSVKYKPEFYTIASDKFDIVEGGSSVINMTARGNPSNIVYVWSKDGIKLHKVSDVANYVKSDDIPTITYDGPVIHVKNVSRSDAGRYQVQARNDEGSTKSSILLNVQYEANITSITTTVIVYERENAHFICEADGNPKLDDMISWRREGFDMDSDRTEMNSIQGKSYLTIYNVTEDDDGEFLCVVNNNVGGEATRPAYLITRKAPKIVESPQYTKAASEKGEEAKIMCRAKGSPNITFTWMRSGAILKVQESAKYRMESNKADYITWESTLYVKDVNPAKDFGEYMCVVRNEEGTSTVMVTLEGRSVPDIPVSIKVLNMTHESVLLAWVPGFDGGMAQSFRIRYRKTGSDEHPYMYRDVFPPNATTFALSRLELGTEYEFSVKSINEKGESAYTTDTVKASTSSIAPPGEREKLIPAVLGPKSKIPQLVIISVSIVGALLLLLNVFLVSCFIYRKKKKRMEEDDSDRSSSKAATVEMYSYANSNNGTVTGETLSSISEKSEQYSDEHSASDYQEESGKGASTYLTDGHNTSYISQSSHPHHGGGYNTYNNKDNFQPTAMLHSPKISNRSLLSDPDVVPHPQDENYVDALRKNAYNLSVNDTSGYNKASVNPPLPPSRNASSGGTHAFYNLSSPTDLTYPTYPNGSATIPRSPVPQTIPLNSPHHQSPYVNGEYRPPVLSTFTQPHSPTSLHHNHHPSSPTRTIPPELDGHLV